MRPSARRKSQRGTRRFVAPRCPSNNHQIADAGTQPMTVVHYIEIYRDKCRALLATLPEAAPAFTRVATERSLPWALLDAVLVAIVGSDRPTQNPLIPRHERP